MILSSGREAAQVPSVIDMPYDDAKKLLEGEEFGFIVKREDVPSSQPEGTVVGQTPTANSELDPGKTVVLQVANGSNAVPDVVGAGIDDAEAELEKAGFKTERVSEATEDPAKIGVVLATDPSDGQALELGGTVLITYGEATGDSGGEPVPPVEG
jgi:serine/threonine-protein kinase